MLSKGKRMTRYFYNVVHDFNGPYWHDASSDEEVLALLESLIVKGSIVNVWCDTPDGIRTIYSWRTDLDEC